MSEVISSRDIGSANPFAKFFRGLADSFKGIVTGLLFIVISFVLVWYMVNQKEHSKTIAELPVLTPAEAEGQNGLMQVQGEPTYSTIVQDSYSGKDVLYYTYSKEDYAVRRIESKRVVEKDGRQIEETIVDYKPEWKTVSGSSDTQWSEFKLGGIDIDPSKAKKKFNTTELYNVTTDVDYPTYKSDEDLVDVPQKIREKVVGVEKDVELVVIGNNSGDKIASGGGETDTFIISNMTPAELLAAQEKSEKTIFWIMAFVAWFLMSNGFTMLLGPITHILNIIPGLGSLGRGLLFFIFGIVSALIIFIAYIGLKFWWVLLLAVIGFVGYRIYAGVKKGDAKDAPKKAEKKEEKKEEKSE